MSSKAGVRVRARARVRVRVRARVRLNDNYIRNYQDKKAATARADDSLHYPVNL